MRIDIHHFVQVEEHVGKHIRNLLTGDLSCCEVESCIRDCKEILKFIDDTYGCGLSKPASCAFSHKKAWKDVRALTMHTLDVAESYWDIADHKYFFG